MNTSSSESVLDPEHQVDMLQSTLQSVLGVGWLSTLITVVLVLLATAVISHLVTRFLRHLLSYEDSPLPQSTIFVNIARVVVWGMGLSVILSTCFGVDVTAAMAALGVGGIALSLGFQDTIANLIGGLQLSIMGIVEPGDHIEMAGNRGVVKDVTWRQVTLETTTGGLVVIPNQIINKNTFTRLPDVEKVVVPINVTKDVNDLNLFANLVEKAVADAVKDVATIAKPPVVLFDSTTELGYAGSVVLWMSEDDEVLEVKDAVVRAIAPFTGNNFVSNQQGETASVEAAPVALDGVE